MKRRAFLTWSSVAACTIACRREQKVGADPAKARPKRIVSISASTTEALFAIGAGALVVGRSRYCDYPPEAQSLPTVGGYVDPNLEAILALRPDLVVGARGPLGVGFMRTLEDHGIATWFPETESFAQILAMIDGLGERTGHDARKVTDAMRARRDALGRALEGKERPRALLLFSKKPITAAGPQSFPDEMLSLAGGTNALREGARYPTLGLETVLKLDPDVILDAEMGPAPEPFDSTWADVRAIKSGRIAKVRDESVLRPGPRVLDGAAALALALHPGISLP